MFITKLSSGKSDSENREIFLVATGVSTLPLRTNIDDEGPLAGADEHLRQVVTNFITIPSHGEHNESIKSIRQFNY